MSIVLHIERLVIDAGVLGSERPAGLRAAIEQEIARQFALPGAVAALRHIGAVDALAGGPWVSATAPLGTRIGQSVATGLGIGEAP